MEHRRTTGVPAQTVTDTEGTPSPDRRAAAARAETAIGAGTLLGRYRVIERIGVGGMGVVFTAHDPELDRTVAAKLLRLDATWSKKRELRLRREAQVMARLAHPNVIRIYDVGEVPGGVFIAMEFVAGGTLRDWLAAESRTPRQILSVFAQAGVGLAAAHDAGLVHRDFKPSNVLVGSDGRVLVTDFGIARSVADGVDDTGELRGLEPQVSMTETGGRLGTPRYMAPEQHLCATVDARADQFSFCVALWEALYEAPPFAGETWPELSDAKASGQLVLPPPDHRLPAHVHAALVRGMQADPTARFPTLHELLAALAHDPRKRRRARIRNVALLAGMLVIGFGAWTFGRRASGSGPACPPPTGRVSSVWNDARRARVRTAFAATASPLAGDAFERAARALDAYLDQWSARHVEVCTASRVHHEQSDEVLYLRMECLGQRLKEVEAEIDVLASADAKIVEQAVRLVASLPSLAACDDVAALRAPVRPLADPVTRARVDQAQSGLARAHAAMTVAKYDDTTKLADTVLAEARSIGYRPLEAEALFIRGAAENKRGDAKAAALDLEDAAIAARSGRDASTELNAWSELVWVGGRYGRYQEAHAWARHGLATFESIGGTDEQSIAYLLLGLGSLLAIEGKYEEALARMQHVLAIRTKAFGPDDIKTAVAVEGVARVLGDLGRYPEQEQYIRRGLAIYEKVFGPEHPESASGLFNLAFALAGEGKYDEAIAAYKRVVANWEKTLGPQNSRLALPLANIGGLLTEQGKLTEGVSYLERALAIAETKGAEHPDVAVALVNLGDAYRLQGKRDEAVASYRRAAVIWTKSFGADYPSIAFVLTGIGLVELDRGAPDKARAPLERALALRGKQPGDLADLASTRFALARAVWASDRQRALELAGKARADVSGLGARGAKQLVEIDAWLEAHR